MKIHAVIMSNINPKGMKLAGRVAKGMDQGCIACHRSVGGDDLEVHKK